MTNRTHQRARKERYIRYQWRYRYSMEHFSYLRALQSGWPNGATQKQQMLIQTAKEQRQTRLGKTAYGGKGVPFNDELHVGTAKTVVLKHPNK